jgi:hypothetical protein
LFGKKFPPRYALAFVSVGGRCAKPAFLLGKRMLFVGLAKYFLHDMHSPLFQGEGDMLILFLKYKAEKPGFSALFLLVGMGVILPWRLPP